MFDDIQALERVYPALGAADQRFAQSLIAQSQRGRGLSDKQLFWVKKLTERAAQPAPAPVAVANVDGVVALLDRAATKLKWPKLRVRTEIDAARDLVLTLAGDKSKHPGTVNVCDSERQWFGRILRDGTFEAGRNTETETATAIVAALTVLSGDPAGTARRYGRLTGSCCFCGTPLSDQRSVDAGYGPICADKWGLPWGEAHAIAA